MDDFRKLLLDFVNSLSEEELNVIAACLKQYHPM